MSVRTSGGLSPALAYAYDCSMWAIERWLRRWRSRLITPLRGDVLELAIGTGANLPFYTAGARVVGIDRDPVMLRRAQTRLRPADALLLMDAERLAFPSGSFDHIVATLALCTIPDPVAALREARRVLHANSDGALHLIEHTRGDIPAIGRLLDTITPIWKHCTGGCHPNRDQPALLRLAGWRVVREETRMGGLFKLLVAAPLE